MALIVEDGTVVTGATSFVTEAEIIAYAAARGVVIPDDAAATLHAIKAMDYFRTLCFRGDVVAIDQELPFPRMGLVDGDTAEDYAHTIPRNIKQAQAQLAVDSFGGIVLTPSGALDPQLSKVKVGPLEREFYEVAGGLGLEPRLVVAMAYLSPHLCDAGSFGLKTVRA